MDRRILLSTMVLLVSLGTAYSEPWYTLHDQPSAPRIPGNPDQRTVAPTRRDAFRALSLAPGAVRRAILAAYEGPPEQAVRMLQEVQSNRRTHNAALESAIGVAYARLSFLTVDPTESETAREKAMQHFRSALAMDPDQKLSSRLVAPQILDLFDASR